MIRLPFVLVFAALLFSVGVYGVLARRNAVMVLMAIELMLNAVNLNLVAFSALLQTMSAQIFALFVIAVAAAEVGIGLAIVILLFRNRASDQRRRGGPPQVVGAIGFLAQRARRAPSTPCRRSTGSSTTRG